MKRYDKKWIQWGTWQKQMQGKKKKQVIKESYSVSGKKCVIKVWAIIFKIYMGYISILYVSFLLHAHLS